MKQISLLQQNTTRRSNSFRGSLDGAGDGAFKSPASLFWAVLHGLCCLISLLLGFRFSRLVFFLLFSNPNSTSTTTHFNQSPAMLRPSFPASNKTESRVVVGRHGIRIRAWPHPNPDEVMRAHKLLERVQKEQRVEYGVRLPRGLIVVTPTYVRTFQTPHLIGLIHSLMNVIAYYDDVTWVVVEAGGVTNETASLIQKSGVRSIIHVGFGQKMPISWSDRVRVEDLMRVEALRLVRDRKLDGIVVFADDSNMHSMEFFSEVQKVEWFGALSIGILVHSGTIDKPFQVSKVENNEGNLPIQGPACNSSDNFIGWHSFNTTPYTDRSALYIGDMGPVLPRKIEWAPFVLNSRLLWEDEVDKPDLIKDLDSFEEGDIKSPFSLLKDPFLVEPLGSCGRKVLLWWLRVEARADSKFPPGWVIKSPLEITVPAKRTPWPDVPLEVPSELKVTTTEPQFVEERSEKRPPKARSRKRSSRKRKRDTRVADTEISTPQLGQK